MLSFTIGSARSLLAQRDPGSLREQLDVEDILTLDRPHLAPPRTGSIAVDPVRTRPAYFDGRFLAARDLTREQNYFLTREADLGRALGAGVVHGLLVEPGVGDRGLRIQAGHGITPSGEMVLIPEPIDVDLADIATLQRLDATFGLTTIPHLPLRQMSGLFVVALYPVEYTANPIAAYPTSLTGQRTVEDGDIVEATAIALVPFPDDGARLPFAQRRARAVHRVFLEGRTQGIPGGKYLPLAMVAAERGVPVWIDNYLVRREVGAEHGDVLGMGFAPRAVQEAFLLQYDHHIQEVVAQRGKTGRFVAAAYFEALPPAGRMPAAAISPVDFSQVFFPAEVDVELTVVPADELRAMLEDSLLLPPIDLSQGGDLLASTSVVVVIPVPRVQLQRFKTTLASRRVALTPLATFRRRPIDLLPALGALAPAVVIPPLSPAALTDALWQQALASTDWVWYMRRRDLSYKEEIVGLPVQVEADDLGQEKKIEDNMRSLGRLDMYRGLRAKASSLAVPVLAGVFGSPKLLASPALTETVLARLEAVPNLDRRAALQIAESVADPSFGAGISRLEGLDPTLGDRPVIRALVGAGALESLDRVGTAVTDEARARAILTEVVGIARSAAPEKDKRLKAVAAVSDVLAAPRVLASPALTEVAVSRLEAASTLPADAATKVAETFSQPALGEGLKRVEAVVPEVSAPAAARAIADSGVLAAVDALGAAVRDPAKLKAVSLDVLALARSNDPKKAAKIRTLISAHVKDIKP